MAKAPKKKLTSSKKLPAKVSEITRKQAKAVKGGSSKGKTLTINGISG